MSHFQSNSNISPLPTQSVVYATDLELPSGGPVYNDSTYSYDQASFVVLNPYPTQDTTAYFNNGLEPVQVYQDPINGPYLQSYPQSGIQYPPFQYALQTNEIASVPNPMQNYENVHQPLNDRHANQNNHRARGRGRGRGNGGYNKRGWGNGRPMSENYEFNNRYQNYNQYDDYSPRGNYRGNRGGYQGMSFHNSNRGRKYDDGNGNQGADNYLGNKYQSARFGYKQNHKKERNYSNDISDKGASAGYKYDKNMSEYKDSKQPVTNPRPSLRGISSIPRDSFLEGERNENYGKQEGRKKFLSLKEKKKSSNGQKGFEYKGNRPKQWSSPQDAEKDESQRGALTEQLTSNLYECMVCCDIIKVESAIWSCQNCYHVFHLHCTKKWAHSSKDKDTNAWRCPGCQNESQSIPSQYRCFCGKRKDPSYIRGETPHSCGETCRRKRKGSCVHPCTILCHPGPCPPCSSMVNQSCDCAKQRKSVRCSVALAYKCDSVCGKTLYCGDHDCQEICHSGSCESCIVSKPQGCFCGKKQRDVLCGTADFEMVSYSCEGICGRTLDCGNHVCEVACHPGECAPCVWDPNVLTSCSCGKTSLTELKVVERNSCLDPIPVCGKICDKPMACGPENEHHLCTKVCHEGSCGPCDKETVIFCQCGRMDKEFACEVAVAFNDKNPFKCQKRCGKKKTCGRHKCSDNCCIKDYHLCEYICGLKLSCGVHKCKELCHRSNCKRCLETSFDELSCYCGATVMEPPIPCGTKPPECQQLCTRPQKCDHPIRHNCHIEDDCAPCTELTEKLCMGGHTVRKNIPCHMKNISCGMPCHKMLPCNLHRCTKICHKGPCHDENTKCTQPCPKKRPACGHPCSAPCHEGKCPQTFCKAEIEIVCPCGNRSAKVECQMGGDHSTEIAQFQRLSVQSIAESGGNGVDMAQFTQTKPGSRRLDCDANCAVLERNKRIALALEIKNPDVSAKLGNPNYTEYLKDFGKKNLAFAIGIEKDLSNLVQTAKKSLHQHRSHSFPCMNRDKRHFVHELAEFYGCQTQSYDFEPKNIVATAYRDKCWLPNVTLTQLLNKDQTKAPPPLSGLKSQGVTFTVLEKKKPPPVVEGPSTSFRAWESVPSTKPSGQASNATPTVDYFDFTEN